MKMKETAAQLQKMGDAEIHFRMGVHYHRMSKEMEGIERALEVGAHDVFMELSDRVQDDLGRLRAMVSELLNRRTQAQKEK